MTFRAATILVLLAACGACAGNAKPPGVPRPTGDVLFELRITEKAFTGPVKGYTGYVFYLDRTRPDAPDVVAFPMHAGKPIAVFGGSVVESEQLLRDLDAVHFEAFDYVAEVKRVEAFREL